MNSLCQSSSHSCGACCGIFNLLLSKQEIDILLAERTQEFLRSTNYQIRWTLSDYRKKREELEQKLPRKEETTYVCPFLGFISPSKIGCLIHPSRTGDPKSQNLSFYGASICQGYDCKTKERPISDYLLRHLEDMPLDYHTYSNLVSDHITLGIILEFFLDMGYEMEEIFSTKKDVFMELLFRKFTIGFYLNQTSFEFPEGVEGTPFQKLVNHLNILEGENLYKRLKEEVSKNPREGF